MSLYETHKNELIKQLIEQMEGVGFCILKNVPGFDENELKKVIMAFHNDNNIGVQYSRASDPDDTMNMHKQVCTRMYILCIYYA